MASTWGELEMNLLILATKFSSAVDVSFSSYAPQTTLRLGRCLSIIPTSLIGRERENVRMGAVEAENLVANIAAC